MKRLATILLFTLLAAATSAQGNYWQHLRRNAPAMAGIVGAGYANGVSDVLQFKYRRSVFPQADSGEKLLWGGRQYWDPSVSWENKYWDVESGNYNSRFPLSKTALVWATDGWHLSKTMQLTFMQMSVVSYKQPEKWHWKLADVLIMKLAFSAGWNLANETLIK